MPYFPHFKTLPMFQPRSLNHDRHSGISRFPAAGRRRSDFGVRNRGPLCRPLLPSIKVLAVTPGPVRSSSGVEMLARGLKPSGAITHPDRGRRRGRARGGDLRQDAGVRAGDGQARRPRRQRLLRRLYPRRSRPARWPPRHHALAAHPAFSCRLSQGETGAGPDLRPRRQHLELGGDQRRHRSGAGDGGGGFRRRDRAEDRAPARALSSPQRRPVAILIAAGIEGAGAVASDRC